MLYLDKNPDQSVNVFNIFPIPLKIAAVQGDQLMLELLLDRGADLNQRFDEKGRTALHEACFSDHCVKFLLSVGADILLEDLDGKTALALMLNHPNVDPKRNVEQPSTRLMIKNLVLKKCLQPSIELKDEITMKQFPVLWQYYQRCIAEIEEIKSMRVSERCTVLELLSKCRCKIAARMRNSELLINFQNDNIEGRFPLYAEDMIRAFDLAQKHEEFQQKQENIIYEAVYFDLPYVIVSNVISFLNPCCKHL